MQCGLDVKRGNMPFSHIQRVGVGKIFSGFKKLFGQDIQRFQYAVRGLDIQRVQYAAGTRYSEGFIHSMGKIVRGFNMH